VRTRRRHARALLLGGLGVVGIYLVVAGVSFRKGLLPAAPVLDGLGPPAPYQWVKPPPDRAKDNKPPGRGEGSVPLTSLGSSGSVTTPDGQAQVLLDNNSVPPQPGQTSVKITIDPLDPDTVGPPPPGGFHYDSNAYRIAAFYEPSNQPVEKISAVIVLSYATFADRIIHWNGSSWDSLPSTPAGQNQLFANTDRLGIFAAAGIGHGTAVKQTSPVLLVAVIVGLFVLIAVVLVLVLRRMKGAGPSRGRQGSAQRR
jgi:hypothetical protein